MEMNEFARINYERSLNHGGKQFDWEFYAIGLGGEAGELLNLLKKIKRGDFELNKALVAEEAADVITYGFLLLSELGVDPEKVIMNKFEKVNKRLEKGSFGSR